MACPPTDGPRDTMVGTASRSLRLSPPYVYLNFWNAVSRICVRITKVITAAVMT